MRPKVGKAVVTTAVSGRRKKSPAAQRGTSAFAGVGWDKQMRRWRTLGALATLTTSWRLPARAYDEAARRLRPKAGRQRSINRWHVLLFPYLQRHIANLQVELFTAELHGVHALCQ